MSDEAVYTKTGKRWNEWFLILDEAGAVKWSHAQIAAYLYDSLGVPGWWNQMVAVAYEQERGLREKHQKPSGYEISSSKTIAAPVERVYAAWDDLKSRKRWLKDAGFEVRKATPNKSLRITWVDGKTTVEANFYSKGEGKSQVAIQHGRLEKADVVRQRAYWAEALGKLKEILEA